MRRSRLVSLSVGGAAALAVPLAVLPFMGANAATSYTFKASPTAGARTANVTASSVIKCPAGTTQANVLAVSHPGQSDENVAVDDFPVAVASDGSWTTTMKFFLNGPTGKWQLMAGCGDPTQSPKYTPINFTVSASTYAAAGATVASPTPTATPTPSASPAASPAAAVSGTTNFTG